MRGFIIAVLLGLAVDVTSGQRSIQLIPQYPVINGAVTLRVTGITEERLNFTWYKGPSTASQYQILTYISGSPDPPVPGDLYNPMITPFSNGSLQIRDLHISDGGNYIVKIQTAITAQDINVNLTVYEPVRKPTITASTIQPKENYEFTLTCDTKKATTITWTRRGAHISSEAKLSGDNSTLTFSSVKREDSGEYWCEAQNLVSKESSEPYAVYTVYAASLNGNYCIIGLALGLTFAIILGVVLIIVGSFYVYRKFAAKRLNESLENRQEDMEVYYNVQAVQVKEEPAYMDLEFESEEIYTEVKIYEIPSTLTQEHL
ncbi:carcinoembryonic antigen-related cell adhesion molecule 7-like [Eleutherodactylus coqui]|uniref:carcinoembryonic antigen-related cell adhesion molecule 7-like n=1 Tax=Eleutherodactylus coqui TaxID=57060 RepID=UPI00346229FB